MASDTRSSKTPKSHLVDKDKLITLKASMGWTDQVLAEQAGISAKTLERIWKGVPVSMPSIDAIARAFRVTCDKIIHFEKPFATVFPPGWGPAVQVPLKPGSRFTVKLTLAIPFEEFDRSERMLSFIEILKEILISTGDVTIGGMERGSTIVTLSMSAQDTLRLLAKMIDGKLASVNITRVDIPDESWLVRMIVSLKLLGSPVDPDEETWSELLNSREVEGVISGWSNRFG